MTIVDLHSHGIDGVDTDTQDPAQVLEIAALQGREGVTEMLLSLYSAPIPVMRYSLEAARRAMELQQATLSGPAVTATASARILGVHLEGPFLNPAWCGTLDGASFLEPNETDFQRLIEGYESIVRIVTIAPEMKGAVRLTRIMANMGIAVNVGHSGATWTEAEVCWRAGARGITHLFNGMKGFHHREPGIVGFGLLNPDIYVEVIGDMIHLSRETLELIFRTKAPDRILLVSDSVALTLPADGAPAPRSVDGRLSGGAMSLPAAARRLVGEGFSEESITMAMSFNPLTFLRS